MKCKIQFRVICSPSKSNLAADCGYKCLLHIFVVIPNISILGWFRTIHSIFKHHAYCILINIYNLKFTSYHLYPCMIFLEWTRFVLYILHLVIFWYEIMSASILINQNIIYDTDSFPSYCLCRISSIHLFIYFIL